MIEEDESGLLTRARKGDFDAFETLVSRSEGKTYSHLLRLVSNEEDARDLLQETYLSAYKSLQSFKGDSAFSTWVYRIATNHALMKLRKKVPQEVAIDEVRIPTHEELKGRSISDWQVDPRDALLRSELRGVLDEAVRRLPALYRAVVLLRDVEELSTEETAQALGITEGAVKTRLHRARIFLREELAPYFEGEGTETTSGEGTMTHKLSCREIFENLSSYIDAELDPDLCEEIEDHMKGCNPCVAFLNTLKKTVVLYKYAKQEDPVPERVHIDLHRFLRQRCSDKKGDE